MAAPGRNAILPTTPRPAMPQTVASIAQSAAPRPTYRTIHQSTVEAPTGGTRPRLPLPRPVRREVLQLPVQAAVLDGFGEVVGLDGVGAFDVGDGAGDTEDLVVGAGA